MIKKILIAPNSFKEVADSDIIAELFKKYLSNVTSLQVETFPITDGGDGFLNVCKTVFNLDLIKYRITTPYDESFFNCEVGYDIIKHSLYVESAKVLGLRVIPEDQRHPLSLSSKGLGDLLLQINKDVKENRLNIKEVFIGVGGTGTNDLGLGACSRFELELEDIYGKKNPVIPEYFHRVKNVKWSKPDLLFHITTISDVNNPLLGTMGATRIYGSQKGADKGELNVLELGFNKILNSLKNNKLMDSSDVLSGAGGGLAAGLHLFFKASDITAEDFIKVHLNLNEFISSSDIVLTGEGNFDEQSFNGKGAGIILNLATDLKKHVILCCGRVDDEVKQKLKNDVEVIELVSFFESQEESISNIEKGIEFACKKIASLV
jgi:glycerate kinase